MGLLHGEWYHSWGGTHGFYRKAGWTSYVKQAVSSSSPRHSPSSFHPCWSSCSDFLQGWTMTWKLCQVIPFLTNFFLMFVAAIETLSRRKPLLFYPLEVFDSLPMKDNHKSRTLSHLKSSLMLKPTYLFLCHRIQLSTAVLFITVLLSKRWRIPETRSR